MTKRVTKHDGEVIELHWEGPADAHYVRGHMTPEEAKQILDAHYDTLCHDVTAIKPAYGRWSCCADAPDPDWPVVLADYATPGPGRFKVMVCTGWRDFTDEELAALNAAREVPDAKT